jgi:hypothetical protein
LIEGTARLLENTDSSSVIEFKLFLQPYRMFAASHPRVTAWENHFTKQPIPSSMVFNNYGYAESFDYQLIPDADYLARHGRKPGEKIVLIAGGSTVHGVGATRNENTIAGRLAYHLNEKSAGTRYRVLNMGMGSWIRAASPCSR